MMSVAFEPSFRLLTFTVAAPLAAVGPVPVPYWMTRSKLEPKVTLSISTGVAPMVKTVTVLPVTVQYGGLVGLARAIDAQAVVVVSVVVVCGGVGDGASGVGYTFAWGKETIEPPTLACPPELSAVGVPALQSPTPVLGVSRLPFTV